MQWKINNHIMHNNTLSNKFVMMMEARFIQILCVQILHYRNADKYTHGTIFIIYYNTAIIDNIQAKSHAITGKRAWGRVKGGERGRGSERAS